MLKFDCVKTQNFLMQNNKKTAKQQQSFGMNPILRPRTNSVPNLAQVAVDVVELAPIRQLSNVQIPSQTQQTNQTQEVIKVIISKSESSESLSDDNSNVSEVDEFYEKDKKADKYFNNCCNTFSKVNSVIPILGGIGASTLANNLGRNEELDAIYGVPEYLPVKTKMSMDTYWSVTAAFHFTIWLSPIATPMALVGLCLNKNSQKNLKNAYHEAYKKEQEQVKNETPEQTSFRHAKLKEDYYKKVEYEAYKRYQASKRRDHAQAAYKYKREIRRQRAIERQTMHYRGGGK
ncbi:MAG: hypothetical protein MRZ90_01445 [Candidatus Gastranaerophilales bacterium]|nr:hypothetical protein [Candidatus Gastranaerophilales bacterium]